MKKAYTLIEIVLAIVILGILVIPIAFAYKQLTVSAARNADLSKAVELSGLEFSIVNSLSYDDATLAGGYNNLTANYQDSGYDLRRQVDYEAGTALTPQSLKRIAVTVYRSGSGQPVITTSTFRARNVTYGP